MLRVYNNEAVRLNTTSSWTSSSDFYMHLFNKSMHYMSD